MGSELKPKLGDLKNDPFLSPLLNQYRNKASDHHLNVLS